MSFRAYLDGAEEKTGRTPQEIVDLAHGEGFGADMALVHVIKNGPGISDQHVGTSGTHRDESTVLRLDGVAARSQGA